MADQAINNGRPPRNFGVTYKRRLKAISEAPSSPPLPSPSFLRRPVALTDEEIAQDILNQQRFINLKFKEDTDDSDYFPSFEADMGIEEALSDGATSDYVSSQAESGDEYEGDIHPTNSFHVSQAVSSKFFDYESENRYQVIRNRDLWPERLSDLPLLNTLGVREFLEYYNLLYSVEFPSFFCRETVLQFYGNMNRCVRLSGHCIYGKVFVQGKYRKFTPESINKFLGLSNPRRLTVLPDLQVIATKLSYPNPSVWQHQYKASLLNPFFKFLYKICLSNWIPSSNNAVVTQPQAELLYRIGAQLPFNLGLVIFETITNYSFSLVHRKNLPCPCLITALMAAEGVKLSTCTLLEKRISMKTKDARNPIPTPFDIPFASMDSYNAFCSRRPSPCPPFTAPDALVARLASLKEQERALCVTMMEVSKEVTEVERKLSSQNGGESATDYNIRIYNTLAAEREDREILSGGGRGRGNVPQAKDPYRYLHPDLEPYFEWVDSGPLRRRTRSDVAAESTRMSSKYGGVKSCFETGSSSGKRSARVESYHADEADWSELRAKNQGYVQDDDPWGSQVSNSSYY